jgi:hypothetical protein
MATAADPLSLAWAILLCVLPFAAGYRFARRFTSGPAAIVDAFLFAYAIQYLSIVPLGFLRLLTPAVITVVGVALSAVSLFLSRRPGPKPLIAINSSLSHAVLLTCFFFVLGFVCAFVYGQRFSPPLATDALAYHLPASVQWLQHRRIDLLPTWFFNPANTFSPLAGSVFITWLMAPLGNDALARFVQIGPLFLIFFAMLELNPHQRAASALVALAAVLSRPLLAEATLPKDDLFVAAFFTVVVVNLSADKLCHPLAPLRLGISIGLFLATKYTAIGSAVLLLIAADAPFRAGWKFRHWLTAAATVVLIACPWYLRNWILTGNPLFPQIIHFGFLRLPGTFQAVRSQQLSSLPGLWSALAAGYFALPPILWIILGIFWLIALVRSAGLLASDSQRRLIILAPPIGILLFAYFSPYAEVRFILPEIVLLFAAIPIALTGEPVLQTVAFVPALVAIATSFAPAYRLDISHYCIVAAIVVVVGIAIWRFDMDRLRPWHGIPRVMTLLALIILGFAMDQWNGYLVTYRQSAPAYWQLVYGDLGQLWAQLDADAPPDCTVAYANQFMIYPLYGFDQKRRVLFVPPAGAQKIQGLNLGGRLSGEQIALAAATAVNSDFDKTAWLKNLAQIHAQYLIAATGAPEISAADSVPEEFHPIFRNAGGVIYQIDPTH